MASILNSEDLRFFLSIVTAPSLAAAARALDVTPSAVTQRLRGLEDRLGTPLLERCGGHLEPTVEGRFLAARGSRVLDELESVTSSLIGQRGRVAGHLRIAAPLGFGRRFVARAATPFVRRYPSCRTAAAGSSPLLPMRAFWSRRPPTSRRAGHRRRSASSSSTTASPCARTRRTSRSGVFGSRTARTARFASSHGSRATTAKSCVPGRLPDAA